MRKGFISYSHADRDVCDALAKHLSDVNRTEADFPRSLSSEDHRRRRQDMLARSHMLPLNEFVSKLRRQPGVEVPDFDPMDGGIGAKILFLFEKPGPMTADGAVGRRSGSGFISRNNDDPTAEATFKFMQQAGIPRAETISWNVVPWWNGTRKITAAELREGAAYVRELVALLPRLRAVVFVGKKATRAQKHLADLNLRFFSSDHPSPIVRAAMPERWRAIPDRWAEAGKRLVGDRSLAKRSRYRRDEEIRYDG